MGCCSSFSSSRRLFRVASMSTDAMAKKAYWQCRVEGCKHPGRSFKSTDAMRRHLMDTHGVSNDCDHLHSCWPAEIVYWTDSDSEKEYKDEAPGGTTVTIAGGVSLVSGAVARGMTPMTPPWPPRQGRSRSRSPVLDAAGAASRSFLMQQVRELPDHLLIQCFHDMVEEMECRLMHVAGPAPATSSCGKGKSKRRNR